MAPKTKEPAQKKPSKNEVKLAKQEQLNEVFYDIMDDFKSLKSKMEQMEKLYKDLNKKKEAKALNPIPVPEAVAKFITTAIKNKKLSEDMMKAMEYTAKSTVTAKDKLDRNQVSKIIWDYIKVVCQNNRDDNGKPVYKCDTELKNLLGVDEFKLTSFQTHFAALYPKTEKKKTRKSDSSDSESDSSDSDSDSSDSDSESGDSDSESEEEEKPKKKVAAKTIKKTK
jgi:hypothetical protein